MTRLASALLIAAMPAADATVVGIDAVPAVARAIAVREGYFKPGAAPRRLRNPGSLVYAGQPGARRTGRRDRVAAFGREGDGWRALEGDIRAKLRRGACLSRGWAYLLCDGRPR